MLDNCASLVASKGEASADVADIWESCSSSDSDGEPTSNALCCYCTHLARRSCAAVINTVTATL